MALRFKSQDVCRTAFSLVPFSLNSTFSWHLFLTFSRAISFSWHLFPSLSLDISVPWHLFPWTSLSLSISSLDISFSASIGENLTKQQHCKTKQFETGLQNTWAPVHRLTSKATPKYCLPRKSTVILEGLRLWHKITVWLCADVIRHVWVSPSARHVHQQKTPSHGVFCFGGLQISELQPAHWCPFSHKKPWRIPGFSLVPNPILVLMVLIAWFFMRLNLSDQAENHRRCVL